VEAQAESSRKELLQPGLEVDTLELGVEFLLGLLGHTGQPQQACDGVVGCFVEVQNWVRHMPNIPFSSRMEVEKGAVGVSVATGSLTLGSRTMRSNQ